MTKIGDVISRIRQITKAEVQDAFVELIEVDKVEAKCSGIQSGCTIMRTKDKLPIFMEGYWGPLIRSVTSIDGSTELQATHPGTYTSMTKSTSFKYNKTRYFWWLNNYMYFPNIDWHAIKLEGVFEGDIENYKCETQYNCTPRYLQNLYVPEFLFAEIEQQVVNQLMNTMKIPAEDADNKLNILR